MRHCLLAIRLLRLSWVLPVLAWLAWGSPAAAQNNPFNSDGFPAARGTYGSFPYEQVDPLSGNLIVSVTDLSLPGPIPLSVSRSYNSKFHKDFEHGDTSVDEWSALGVGWRMHFGRVLHAAEPTPGTTVIEGPDGGGGPLYQTSAYPEGWITKGFVRYDRGTNTAKFPNGLVYTFGHVGEASGPRGQVRYVTAITDQFGAESRELARRAREVLARITDPYQKAYYAGIIDERLGHAQLAQSVMHAEAMAYESLTHAMESFEKAEQLRQPGNDDAILRWNTCARTLDRLRTIEPAEGQYEPSFGE